MPEAEGMSSDSKIERSEAVIRLVVPLMGAWGFDVGSSNNTNRWKNPESERDSEIPNSTREYVCGDQTVM